jgi:hypothetical protein
MFLDPQAHGLILLFSYLGDASSFLEGLSPTGGGTRTNLLAAQRDYFLN